MDEYRGKRHTGKRGFAARVRLGAAALTLGLACAFGMSACAQEEIDPTLDTTDTSGGVAVTVNGVEIGENAVTAYIENYRAANDLEDDDAWGTWMIDYEYTFESLRSLVVNYYVDRELLQQAAEENGVSVTDEEVQTGIDTARARFESDEEWTSYLESVGLNEETYYDQVHLTLLQDALIEELGADVVASDDEVLEYVQAYATIYDGSKRSSHILFAADDEETAQEVLDQINAGEIDFAEAAAEYSIDAATADLGGDVGWDAASTFVDEYQAALDELEVGEVSGLVTSEYGIHIIMCTDQFESPDEINSLDDVSEGFLETMREMADSAVKLSTYNTYMEEFEEASEIEKTALPDDASYVIDLTSYEQAALGISDDSDDSDDADDADDSENTDDTDAADDDDAEEADD